MHGQQNVKKWRFPSVELAQQIFHYLRQFSDCHAQYGGDPSGNAVRRTGECWQSYDGDYWWL